LPEADITELREIVLSVSSIKKLPKHLLRPVHFYGISRNYCVSYLGYVNDKVRLVLYSWSRS